VRNVIEAAVQTAGYVLLTAAAAWALLQFA
jgi:hypothetical protein